VQRFPFHRSDVFPSIAYWHILNFLLHVRLHFGIAYDSQPSCVS
jgi:hypothetical protein